LAKLAQNGGSYSIDQEDLKHQKLKPIGGIMRSPIEIFRGTRNPIREMQHQMDRLMEEFSAWPSLETAATGTLSPRCNVSEDGNNYYIKFEIPGIKKDQIKVELNNNVLSVSAERKEEVKKEDEKQYFAELSYGSYFRSMTLPTAVDEKKVDATFENGILALKLPKLEGAKTKQISIH
jgi:HSP20 family protein